MARKKEAVSGKDLTVQKAEEKLGKEAISPMERWKRVAEVAYYRAQKRGFIGGDPLKDWMEAEKEVDAECTVDYSRIMASFDPSEVMAQFAKVFGGVLHQPNLDEILEGQRKNIEALASANKLIFDDVQGIVDRQMEMFRDTMDQAVSSVKNMAKAKSAKDVAGQQARLIQLGVEKSLGSMRDIAESITKANAQAFDIANKRTMENMSEFKRFVRKFKE